MAILNTRTTEKYQHVQAKALVAAVDSVRKSLAGSGRPANLVQPPRAKVRQPGLFDHL